MNNFTGKKGFYSVFNRTSPLNQQLKITYKNK